MPALIIDGADVHDYVAGVKQSRVSGAFDICYTVSAERHGTSIV